MSKALDLFFFFGRPFSPLYGALMKSRETLYRRGLFRQHSLPVPVISIGNLVLGGTGKTPTVRHVAQLLQNNGYHPAIVSRGYRGKTRKPVNIVSDGENTLLSPALAGDEPYWLATVLPGVPVLTGTDRIIPCRYAVSHSTCDVIILDDGFQHLPVKRDVDLVLFDSTVLAGNSRIFPGGILREPVSALNRCHAFLMTGATDNNRPRVQKFIQLLQQRFPGRPAFVSSVSSSKLVASSGEEATDNAAKKMFAFCGIANPERFANSLVSHGLHLAGFQAFPDHAVYNQSQIAQLCNKAVMSGASHLVTTEKDFVKLQNLKLNLPLLVLQIQYCTEQSFDIFLLNSLNNSGIHTPSGSS